MRVYAARLLLLASLFQSLPLHAQRASKALPASNDGIMDLQSFRQELQRIKGVLSTRPQNSEAVSALRSSLPPKWIVETLGRNYEIPSDQLQFFLEQVRDPSKSNQSTEQAQEWLSQMGAEVDGYVAANNPSYPAARTKLDHILAAQEFGMTVQQTAWERLRERIYRWFEQLLARVAQRVIDHPTAGATFFWLLLLGSVAAVALYLFRMWSEKAQSNDLKVPTALAVTQTWQEWIHVAQKAAERGAYRDAVHSAYWAGVVYLEDSRILPRDRSRTPRERLRQVPVPAEAGRLSVLQALTSRLERVWYADAPATQKDFTDSLGLVNELGCRWQ